jgi:hypothetical protein
VRPPLLPEDLRFLGSGREALKAIAPRLEPWLHWVFTVLGGQMAAVGALTLAAAIRLFRRKVEHGRELLPLGVAGALSVGLMSAVNVALASDSRWLLILPAGFWGLGLVLAVLSLSGAATAEPAQDIDGR